MEENQAERGSLLIGIKVLRKEDGDFEYQRQMFKKGIPREIIIMQLKSIVKELEQEYFKSFKDKPSY